MSKLDFKFHYAASFKAQRANVQRTAEHLADAIDKAQLESGVNNPFMVVTISFTTSDSDKKISEMVA